MNAGVYCKTCGSSCYHSVKVDAKISSKIIQVACRNCGSGEKITIYRDEIVMIEPTLPGFMAY
jgi:RNase P subunit RPR2